MAVSIRQTNPDAWDWAFVGEQAAINRMSLRRVARELSRKLGRPVSPATVITTAKKLRNLPDFAEAQPTATTANAFDERREDSYTAYLDSYEKREMRKLLRADHRWQQLLEMVERVAPLVERQPQKPRERVCAVADDERVVVGVLSDTQTGTRVDALEVGERFRFDSNVFVHRFRSWWAQMWALIREQRKLGRVDRLVLWLVGDLIENHRLHGESSVHNTDLGNVTACKVLADLLVDFAVATVDEFGLRIDFECVPGNHDRIGEKQGDDPSYETWAAVVMEFVRRSLHNYDEVTVTMHTQEGAYLAYWDWTVYLHHGHGIAGTSKAPVGNVAARALQVEDILRNRVDYAIFGHFHAVASQMTNSGMEVWINGSWFPTNAYAYKHALATEAQQLAFVLTRADGIIYTRKLHLGDGHRIPAEQPMQRMSA